MSDVIKDIANLSPRKRELLLQRLRQERENISQIKIRPQSRNSSTFPLSFAQQRLWFLSQFEPDNPFYNQSAALRLTGMLNLTALEQSFNEIVHRHEVLRTTFTMVEGQPVQMIAPTLTLTLPVVDLQELPEAEEESEVLRLYTDEAQQSVNLAEGPLQRYTLLWLNETEHVLLCTMHHIISDAWSQGIFIRELATLYAAFCAGQPSPLPELPIQYADFAAWQRQWLQGEVLQSQTAYWRKQLEGAPAVLELPTDQPRPAVQTFRGASYDFKLSQELLVALNQLSQQARSTLFMTLLAAFKVLLGRYTGSEDIVVGTPIANRHRAEIEGLIGFFVNTLVLRTNLSGNPSFKELLTRVREVGLGAYAHQDLPFEQLVEELQPQRSLSHTPLFQVMFALQNAPISEIELSGLTLSPVASDSDTAKFDLTLNMEETTEGLLGTFEYNTDLFKAATIEQMQGCFQTLLEGIVTNPDQKLANLPLLTAAQRHQLLVGWNNTQADYPRELCIHQLIEAQVEQTPDAVAVVFEEQSLTYRELNTRANQLAHHLRSLGVKPEVLVGICMERSLELVVGLLGILKAGGAYVPLDSTYPQERLALMMQDAQAPILLTQSQLLETLPLPAKVICLDTQWNEITQHNLHNPESGITAANLAYVIYTSGSTGKPKGVMNTHRGLCNRLLWMQEAYQLTPSDRVLQKTPFSFDVSVWEFFWPLLSGARLIVAQPGGHQDSAYLVQLIASQEITTLHFVPSMLQVFLEEPGLETCKCLKQVICSGEALPFEFQQRFFARLDAELHNLYGPTEAAIDVTFWHCQRQSELQTVPIGRPIANTQIYILDSQGQSTPIGVPGELHIGGDGLARGYLSRPELTAEKFIPNPFSSQLGTRLYKTGDLARYCESGDIEYIGRIDHQVKIRGFRIELGEIEAALIRHPAVRESVVVVREDDSPNDRHLVAYIVSNANSGKLAPQLRNFLEERLPQYMLPAAFVGLKALPLTPNGKVDRKALPVPDSTQLSSQSPFVAPATPIEEMLVGIWTQVLGLKRVGTQDNFFALGGHSLLATRVVSQVRQVFQIELPLRRLFEKPTVADLAKDIETATRVGVVLEVPSIQRLPREGKFPLSFAQQRLWFLAQLEPDSPFYNIPAAVRLQGQLNRGALEQTFNEILHRHEALRMNFETVAGQPMALISPVTPLQLPLLDLSELPHTHKAAEVKQLASAEAQHPFNLKCDLLLRVKLLRLGRQEHVLLVTMHHIASDGWSIGVMVGELTTLYAAFCAGQPSPLPELPIQYADFAAWQRQWLQGEVLQSQTAYWRKQLEGAPAVLELPTDQPRPAVQTFRGASYDFKLSQELLVALNQLSQQARSTLFMTLLAAFKVLLGRYTGSEDIVVGTPIANRHRAEIEGLIGFFVNTLVLRTNLSGNPSFKELLTRVREVGLGAYAHQDLPFEQLVEELQPQRSLSHTPLFQVMFALQNAPISEIELSGLTLSPVASDSDTAKFDLTLNMEETTEGLLGTFEYNTDLFKAATIEQMQGCFQTLLEGIVTNPDQKLANLPLLTAAQRHQLLVGWNNTQADYPRELCIHQLIEAQVEQTPDAVAVVFEEQSLTYRELNTRANQLAHHLRSLGVKPEVLVGICMERSLELVVGLLGILKAGGAYVPLDSTYPQERLALMMQDAQAPILLTQSQLLETLPLPAKVICLDTQWNEITQHNLHNPESGITAANLAYVIYTSGSTGKPKGVMNTHRGLCNRLLWMQEAYQLTPSDRVLQKTPFSFDVSVWEFFWPLLSGARLIVAQPGGHQDSAYLVQLIASQEITTLHFVPSMLQVFLEEPGLETCKCLKQVICSGEALPFEFQQRFFARLDAELHNLYGPTEAAIDVTFWHCQRQSELQTVPIGRPIANTQIYILDSQGQSTPIGVPGELHIGGDGLARGYLNRPELTAQMFIPNPFQEDSAVLPSSLRLYKTGDLARYRLDGSIEFLDRLDNQVKVRGFRIELGEIEATLAKHPQVLTAVAVIREQFGDRRLIAYVVPSQALEVSTSTLRHFLLEKLPEYMVPAAFVQLEALPLTPNGKVNRQVLPPPDVSRNEINVVLPRNGTEKVLATIFADVLRLEKVSVYDNFFELGGHSLLATQVISRLREAFDMELPLRSLFERSTVAGLAERLETIRLITQVSPPSVAVGKGRKEIEL